MATREQIADRITELLIEHFDEFQDHEIGGEPIDISYFQRVVRNGHIQQAGASRRSEDERLVLYRSDVKANEEDIGLLDFIYETYNGPDLDLSAIELSISTTPVNIGPGMDQGYHDLIRLVVDGDIISFSNDLMNIFFQNNLGQFIDFNQTYAPINTSKVTQILDTNIFELAPASLTQQQRINRFFREYNELKPPRADLTAEGIDAPLIDTSSPSDYQTDYFDEVLAALYSDAYDISNAPPEDIENRYITWLQDSTDSNNENRSLEWLRTNLNDHYFLQQETVFDLEEGRPEYTSRSAGYLKIRGLNQAIIIRNEESNDMGLGTPNNPTWQSTGFTIAMWVRFLDKVNSGTLFNFGNPLRNNDPMGFALETFIVEKESYAGTSDGVTHFSDASTFNSNGFFLSEDVERFVRLVVKDGANAVRDSHVGNAWKDRIDTRELDTKDKLDDFTEGVSPFNYTRIPIDFSEWYYIVATYNPTFEESLVEEGLGSTYINDPDFWRGNINDSGYYTPYSGLGAQCKVEIISRSDLMRARGFQP